MYKILFFVSLLINILLTCLSVFLVIKINSIPPITIPHSKFVFSPYIDPKIKIKDYPQFGTGYIDPYDAQKGEMEVVSINVQFSKPISQVYVSIKGDTITTKSHQLELVDGSKKDGTWQGSWKAEDTYKNTYVIQFQAYSEDKSQYKMEMQLRTPPLLPLIK